MADALVDGTGAGSIRWHLALAACCRHIIIFPAARAGEPEESMRRLLTGGVGLIMLAALWLLLRRFVRR